MKNDSIIFGGSSHPELTKKICEYLNKKNIKNCRGNVRIDRFPSGEIYCKFLDNIRGKNVYIVQSMDNPSQSWMELFLLVHTARLASANKIVAVLSYMSYCRQDRKTEPRSPISAKLMLDLLNKSGADKVITVDIHNPCIQGFASTPLDSLLPSNLWINFIKKELIKKKKDAQKWVLASVDLGGAKKVEKYSQILEIGFSVAHKHRLDATSVVTKGLMGDVKGKNVIIIDDMSESLNSLIQCSITLKENGAKDIYAFVTHLPLTKQGIENLDKATDIKQIITTDTVGNIPTHEKIKVISVADLLAEAIECNIKNKSISKLFLIGGF